MPEASWTKLTELVLRTAYESHMMSRNPCSCELDLLMVLTLLSLLSEQDNSLRSFQIIKCTKFINKFIDEALPSGLVQRK